MSAARVTTRRKAPTGRVIRNRGFFFTTAPALNVSDRRIQADSGDYTVLKFSSKRRTAGEGRGEGRGKGGGNCRGNCGGEGGGGGRGALRGVSPRTREGRRPDRPGGRSPWRRLRSGDRQP